MESVIQFKLNKIPKQPGVYLWEDKYGQIIYVGKAKNLFNRTHQYFNKTNNQKTSLLVQNIADIDFIVVKNENESLILEANLIHKYQPRFNILLKDSSNYPFILLTNDEHPRLLYTRNFNKNKGVYYGPFATNKSNRYDTYNLLLKLFPFRKCQHVPKRKCLFYDIGECLGPCIHHFNKDKYVPYIKGLDDFFKGDPKWLISQLTKNEKSASKLLNFEEAKRNLDLINQIRIISKEMSLSQNVTLKSDRNIDVIGYYVYNNNITIVIFSYINGKLLAKHQQISDIYGDVSETTTNYLNQFYFKSFNLPKKCFVNLDSNTLKLLSSINKISFINPITGKYRSILQTVANNAKTYYQSNYLVFKKHQKTNELAFKELKDILSIDNLSLINVFDMSNLFGSDKVGAMIALENGQFNKQLYRKFIIKDINANTDSQYMYEVIKRQYSKVIKDEGTLPNLIMVDGGLIQINVTIKALSEIHLDKIIPVIGLVKNNQHKTRGIIFSNKKEIFLDPKSSLYMYLFNIQEEVHRYAISFFKKRNINSMFKSRLNDIKGLGDKSIKKLLGHYDNIANIKKASIEDLSQYVSKDIAIKIHRSFN